MLRNLVISLLKAYFRIVPVPSSLLQFANSRADATVVTQSRSVITEALLTSFAERIGKSGLRYAPNTHDPSCLEWVSVHDFESIERVYGESPPREFTTLNIFYGRGPSRNRPGYRPGILRDALMLVVAKFLVILFGPAHRPAATGPNLGRKLARLLRMDFYKNLKLVRGTPFQSFDVQQHLVLSSVYHDPEYLELKAEIPERKLRRSALRAFREMAAHPFRPMYLIGSLISRAILSRLFTEVRTEGLEEFSRASREHTTVLVPMHRSHLDYILLGQQLYESNLNPPVVAAGINLGFWPMGWIIRSLGGYFVKRNARQDRMHAIVLKHYVAYLTRRGHLQEFFIEGGRSRSGKMMRPKLGILQAILSAYEAAPNREVLFIPVSITYENVIEDKVYAEENTGRSKEKESLLALFKVPRILQKKYGAVIVNFGTAISLSKTLSEFEATGRKASGADSPARYIASLLIARIRDQSHLTLSGLTCTALMMTRAYGQSRAGLEAATLNLARVVSVLKPLKPEVKFTPALQAFLDGRGHALHDMERGGPVSFVQLNSGPLFFIPGNRRYLAEFYKNSALHLLLVPALLAVSELRNGMIRGSDIAFFHELFEKDLNLPPLDPFLSEVDRTIDAFSDAGWISRYEDGWKFRTRESGIFIPALLSGAFESLLWTLRNVHACWENSSDGIPISIEYSSFTAMLQAQFKAETYLGRFSRTEAASLSNLQAAIETLQSRGTIRIEHGKGSKRTISFIAKDTDLEQKLHDILRAIDLFQTAEVTGQ